MLIKFVAELMATEPDSNWPKLLALIIVAVAILEFVSQRQALCHSAKSRYVRP
jgi:hypothetical protein